MSHMPCCRLRVVSLVVLLGASWWGTCFAQPLPVQTAQVVAGDWSRQIKVLGRVESIGSVTLNAPIGGRVLGPFLPTGNVAKGARVARIAPPGLAADTKAARVRVAYAHMQLVRAHRLYKDGVVARENVDQARLVLAQARASLSALEARAGQQMLMAPFPGLLHYLVPPGAVVNAGNPIARLVGRGEPWAEAYVTPGQATDLRPGAVGILRTQGWRGEGRIRSVGRSARHSGLVSVYVTLPQTSPLLPGQWLRLTLPAVGGRAFDVPTQAVVMEGAQAHVFTIRAGHAYPIAVQVVATRGDQTWVKGQLQSGETLVVSGSGLVASGTAVVAVQR